MPHCRVRSKALTILLLLPGCFLVETEDACVVPEICGPNANDESALQACAEALEHPEQASNDLLRVCVGRAERCDAGAAPARWCPSTVDAGSDGGPTNTPDAGAPDAGDAGLKPELDASDCLECDASPAEPDASACAQCPSACDEASGRCLECLHDDDCTGTLRCHPELEQCVACLGDGDCGSTEVCDTETSHSCVQCLSDDHCNPAAPRCDLTTNQCAQCLEHADCTDPAASRCNNGSCSPCTGPLHCDHIQDRGVCETSSDSAQCVQCTGTQYQACGTDSVTGRPFVCDSVNRTCTDRTSGSSGLCGGCVSDAECPTGQLCVLQEFDNATIGYFCMWHRGAGVGGAPAACTTARPYFKGVSNMESIDGTIADVCTLAVSTCPAHNDFRNVDCAPNAAPDDSLCGAPGVSDAYCRPLPPPEQDSYRCTVPCLSSDDCRVGSDCDTVANPPYCKLST